MASMLLLSSTIYAVEMSKSHIPTQMTTMSKSEAIQMLKDAGVESSKIAMLEHGEMAKTEGENWFTSLFRIGNSYSRSGNFRTFGARWGSNDYYARNLPRFLRGPATRIRSWRFPGNSWRVRDPGHFHFWRR